MKRIFMIFLALLFVFLSCGCSCKHEIEIIAGVNATCENEGISESEKCSKCGKVLKEGSTLPKTEHALSAWIYTEKPTCTEKGVKFRTCLYCADYEERAEEEALGHNYEISENGYLCTRCGDVFIDENKITVCGKSAFSGDFRLADALGVTADRIEYEIGKLTTGYATMEINQYGEYVWNKTAVKSYTKEEDKTGNLIITIEINDFLKFSNGTPIKAVNYIAPILAYNSPVALLSKRDFSQNTAILGWQEFAEYGGPGTYGKKEFAGVRLLGDYKFSITINDSSGYYPYYYSETYSRLIPQPLGLVLGEGIKISDDGKGAFLSENWYETRGGKYVKTSHILSAIKDIDTHPYSGAYIIQSYDRDKKICVLKKNQEFIGNFEKQIPKIETVIYKEPSDDDFSKLLSGEIDVCQGLKEASEIKSMLAAIKLTGEKFAAIYYARAGAGSIKFTCDFSPTMFSAVRKAIAHLLDIEKLAFDFTGGFGMTVYGPYTPYSAMYRDVGEKLILDKYEFSPQTAERLLIEDGWIYNSKGEAFESGKSDADAVRYKKLSEKDLNNANINFKATCSTNGVVYKTVNIGGQYYMPLAINWFGTKNNIVTQMLRESFINSDELKKIGMVICLTEGDFAETISLFSRKNNNKELVYSMFNMAVEWSNVIYDDSWCWTILPEYFDEYSTNHLIDEYDVAFPYFDKNGAHTTLSFDEAMKASGGKLGIDYLSMAMVYDAENRIEYNHWWKAYIERWNALLPDIPLYSNYIFDIYNTRLQNYITGPYWTQADAIIYANVYGYEE